MTRDEALLLDIFDAGQKVLEFSDGMSQADLETDEKTLSAILYKIEIIGEATKRLSSGFREQNSNIPWKKIAGMRDIIVHEYNNIKLSIVWIVINQSIPELLEKIAPLLPEKPESEISQESPNINQNKSQKN